MLMLSISIVVGFIVLVVVVSIGKNWVDFEVVSSIVLYLDMLVCDDSVFIICVCEMCGMVLSVNVCILVWVSVLIELLVLWGVRKLISVCLLCNWLIFVVVGGVILIMMLVV